MTPLSKREAKTSALQNLTVLTDKSHEFKRDWEEGHGRSWRGRGWDGDDLSTIFIDEIPLHKIKKKSIGP